MRKLIGCAVVLLLVGLAAAPASAQFGDPLALASSGVILPFFSDTASGFISVLEVASPIVQIAPQSNPPKVPINPLHFIFYSSTCSRLVSAGLNETNKQAVALITSSPSVGALTTNGLVAVGSTANGNDLNPLVFPIHSRTHWLDLKTGRVRVLEPITVDIFLATLVNDGSMATVPNPPFNVIGVGNGVGGTGSAFAWNPLRSGATFVTVQDTATVQGSLILICPRASLSAFPTSRFLTLTNSQNDTGTTNQPSSVVNGFPPANAVTGNSSSVLRGRIYDDNEAGPFDVTVPCDCLTTTNLTAISGIYATAPTNLGGGTAPVWYTELEAQRVTVDPTGGGTFHEFSFTGYLNLNVSGSPATDFHRVGSVSRQQLSGPNSFIPSTPVGGAFFDREQAGGNIR